MKYIGLLCLVYYSLFAQLDLNLTPDLRHQIILNDGILLNPVNDNAAGPVYDSSAAALFARFSVQPSAADKGYINTLILALKRDTLWTKYDALYVFAIGTNKNDALLNWKGNFANCTFGSEPSWTAYKGFVTTDPNTKWLNSNYNPTSFAGVYTQDNAGISLYTLDTGVTVGLSDCGTLASAVTVIIINAINLSRFYADINTTTDVQTTNSFTHGLFSASRITSTDISFYRNGSLIETKANSSTGLTNNIFYICCRNNGSDLPESFSVNTYAIVKFGSGLTDYQAQMESNDWNQYMTSIGNNVY